MAEEKKKLAVLHILEATTGGTRRHLVDITAALDKEKFDVSVACATRRDPAFLPDVEKMRAAGVDVTVIPMVRSINLVSDIVALARLVRLLKGGSFDIVHTHSSKAGFLGRLAARLTKVPVAVHTAHVFAFQMSIHPAIQSLYLALERLVAPLTRRFICVCEDEKTTAVKAGLAPADRFVVIPNGLPEPDPDPPPPPTDIGFGPEHVIIGTIGRLTRQKRHVDLILAAKSVVKHAPRARFVIVGTGELQAELEALIDELALRETVRIINVRDSFESYYPAIDIFALPSAWEGMPYALLDAMSHGNAIVATRVGGVPEAIYDDESGLLVPPADPAALAIALVRLVNEPDLRSRLGTNAQKAVAGDFSLERMVEQTEELYEELAARSAGERLAPAASGKA